MFISGKDTANPVYLVTPSGELVSEADGTPVLFEGEAREDHPSGYLVDNDGNYLLGANGEYLPSPQTSDSAAPNPPDEQEDPPEEAGQTAILATPDTASNDAPLPTAKDIPSNTDAPSVSTPVAPAATAPVRKSVFTHEAQATHVMPAAPAPTTPAPAAAPSFPPASAAHASAPAPSPQQYAQPQYMGAPAPIYTQQPVEQRSKSRWPLIILIALLVAALGVGAGWAITHYLNGSDTPNNTDVSDDPTVSDDTTIVPDIPKVIRIPADAYPGAGEAQIPSDAWLTGESDGSFDWMAPSENIRCWSNGYSDEMRCMIASWQDDAPEGYSSSGRPADTVILGIDGTPTLAADGGPIGHVDSTLLYDTTIYDANRNWVCGAKENGITCWSLRSGHGFLINRAGLQAF